MIFYFPIFASCHAFSWQLCPKSRLFFFALSQVVHFLLCFAASLAFSSLLCRKPRFFFFALPQAALFLLCFAASRASSSLLCHKPRFFFFALPHAVSRIYMRENKVPHFFYIQIIRTNFNRSISLPQRINLSVHIIFISYCKIFFYGFQISLFTFFF